MGATGGVASASGGVASASAGGVGPASAGGVASASGGAPAALDDETHVLPTPRDERGSLERASLASASLERVSKLHHALSAVKSLTDICANLVETPRENRQEALISALGALSEIA